jgi:methionyl-tRNA formyltransferase
VLGADADGIRVACGVDSLTLTVLQRPGGRRLTAGEFLQRTPLASGARAGGPAP